MHHFDNEPFRTSTRLCGRALLRTTLVAMALLLAAGKLVAASAAEVLVASWAIRVAGDDTQRTLRITGVEAAEAGAPRVTALIGYRGQRLVAMAVEVGEEGGVLTMRFTTPLGARAELRQAADGSFQGQWTVPSGAVHALQMTRIAPGEDTATRGQGFYIVKPGADVPARCAGFSGLWEGEWIFGARGKAWIWVLEVDAACQAKIAVLRELRRPTGFRMLQIGDGVMSVTIPNGRDVYKLAGDTLRAVSTQFHQNTENRGAFQRIEDPLP